ncbi:unnamed protein product, partial [Nesidiocoris tenuis]
LARRGVWHSPVASGAKPDPIQPGFAWLRKIRNVQQKLTPRVLQGAQCRILRNGIFSEFISSMDFEICSKWKYCDRPKIENRNGASEKTFSHTHLLRITSRTSYCVLSTRASTRHLALLSGSAPFISCKSRSDTEALHYYSDTIIVALKRSTPVMNGGPLGSRRTFQLNLEPTLFLMIPPRPRPKLSVPWLSSII